MPLKNAPTGARLLQESGRRAALLTDALVTRKPPKADEARPVIRLRWRAAQYGDLALPVWLSITCASCALRPLVGLEHDSGPLAVWTEPRARATAAGPAH